MLPSLETRIRAELGENGGLCPICGRDWIIEGADGYDYGVCPRCFLTAKTNAVRAHALDRQLDRDYTTARQQKSRAERSGKVPRVSSRKIKPDFDSIR